MSWNLIPTFYLWQSLRGALTHIKINWEYLTPSDTHTGCPYKGEASYYNAVVNGEEYKDIVWWYKNPITESALINGMVRCPQQSVALFAKAILTHAQLCFYPDKVDMWIDGKNAGSSTSGKL